MFDTDKYTNDGHLIINRIASPEVVEFFLAVVRADMGPDTNSLKRFAGQHEMLGNKPTYEIYGYQYRPLLTFQWGLTSMIEQVTGKTLLPSYAYFRVYSKDSVCRIHSDRFSSQHSITMSLGYGDDVMWPVEIGHNRLKDDEVNTLDATDDFGDEPYTSAELQPGDALLYHGSHYRHGRLLPNPNRWSAHCFMHWVEKDGPYSEFAFDKWKLPEKPDFPFF